MYIPYFFQLLYRLLYFMTTQGLWSNMFEYFNIEYSVLKNWFYHKEHLTNKSFSGQVCIKRIQ